MYFIYYGIYIYQCIICINHFYIYDTIHFQHKIIQTIKYSNTTTILNENKKWGIHIGIKHKTPEWFI